VTALERLRQAAELLPAGTSVTLPRETLLEALGGAVAPAETPSGDLTVAQLAERFQRSPSTVRGWLEAGRFDNAYKLSGRDWRVPVADVEAFVLDQRTARQGDTQAADLGAWREHRKAANG